jgi:hypothetical protein
MHYVNSKSTNQAFPALFLLSLKFEVFDSLRLYKISTSLVLSGISLTEEQWSAFKKNIPAIEKAITKMESRIM